MKTVLLVALLLVALFIAWITIRGTAPIGTPQDAGLGIVGALMTLAIAWRAVDQAARRQHGEALGGPNILQSAVIWVTLIAIVVMLYNGASFWTNLGALFR